MKRKLQTWGLALGLFLMMGAAPSDAALACDGPYTLSEVPLLTGHSMTLSLGSAESAVPLLTSVLYTHLDAITITYTPLGEPLPTILVQYPAACTPARQSYDVLPVGGQQGVSLHMPRAV